MSGQIEKAVKEERLHTVEKTQKEVSAAILRERVENGRPLEVLIEECNDGTVAGHSREFIPVFASGTCDLVGQTVSVVPLSSDVKSIKGSI